MPTFAIVPSHWHLLKRGRGRASLDGTCERETYYLRRHPGPAKKKKGQDPDFPSPLKRGRPPTTARVRTSSHQPNDTVPLGPASFFPPVVVARQATAQASPHTRGRAKKATRSDGPGLAGTGPGARQRAQRALGKRRRKRVERREVNTPRGPPPAISTHLSHPSSSPPRRRLRATCQVPRLYFPQYIICIILSSTVTLSRAPGRPPR